ncbi:MAG: sulfite exporter TauE/SafE family protein [Hyphomicrobiales bacterium]|nr:sulfite exporter TauE/SafE family protein [Hyphomicrobiales bacterium]
MQIYLPIAELSMSVLLLLGMGASVGFLSGMFGVGGGFLMTPLLIFSGIPPAVAVGTEANQIVASSVSGMLAHWRRRSVDFKMGLVLFAGSVCGSIPGVFLFRLLRSYGQVDLLISISYVVFLGGIGSLMLVESVRAMRAGARETPAMRRKRPRRNIRFQNWPMKMVFRQSRLCISVIPPLCIGFVVGVLAAIMGVGGGFIMVPAMIYLLRMPTNVVIGTSLFQVLCSTSVVTLLHASTNQTVDTTLALILMIGGVLGAQLGVRAGRQIANEQLRALLALLVLAVCFRLGLELFLEPAELFVTESPPPGF